jgi:hypothetical protein
MTAASNPETRSTGTISIVLAVLVAVLAFALGSGLGWMIWLLVIGEVAALVLGAMAWHTGAGKLGVILALLLTIGVLVWARSGRSPARDSAPPAETAPAQ